MAHLQLTASHDKHMLFQIQSGTSWDIPSVNKSEEEE